MWTNYFWGIRTMLKEFIGQDVPRVAVAVVVYKEDKVLMGKRIASHGTGSWQLPGGHLDFFETIEDCARREVFEETGIFIKNLRYRAFTNDFFEEERKHYVTLFIFADYDGGILRNKEPDKCQIWEWFDCKQLPKPLFSPIENLTKQGIDLC